MGAVSRTSRADHPTAESRLAGLPDFGGFLNGAKKALHNADQAVHHAVHEAKKAVHEVDKAVHHAEHEVKKAIHEVEGRAVGVVHRTKKAAHRGLHAAGQELKRAGRQVHHAVDQAGKAAGDVRHAAGHGLQAADAAVHGRGGKALQQLRAAKGDLGHARQHAGTAARDVQGAARRVRAAGHDVKAAGQAAEQVVHHAAHTAKAQAGAAVHDTLDIHKHKEAWQAVATGTRVVRDVAIGAAATAGDAFGPEGGLITGTAVAVGTRGLVNLVGAALGHREAADKAIGSWGDDAVSVVAGATGATAARWAGTLAKPLLAKAAAAGVGTVVGASANAASAAVNGERDPGNLLRTAGTGALLGSVPGLATAGLKAPVARAVVGTGVDAGLNSALSVTSSYAGGERDLGKLRDAGVEAGLTGALGHVTGIVLHGAVAHRNDTAAPGQKPDGRTEKARTEAGAELHLPRTPGEAVRTHPGTAGANRSPALLSKAARIPPEQGPKLNPAQAIGPQDMAGASPSRLPKGVQVSYGTDIATMLQDDSRRPPGSPGRLLPGQRQQLEYLGTPEGQKKLWSLLDMQAADPAGSPDVREGFFADVALKVRELALLGQGTHQAEIGFLGFKEADVWKVHPFIEIGSQNSVHGIKALEEQSKRPGVTDVFDGHTHPLLGYEHAGGFSSGSPSTGFSSGDLVSARQRLLYSKSLGVDLHFGNVAIGGGAVSVLDLPKAEGGLPQGRIIAAAGGVVNDDIFRMGDDILQSRDVVGQGVSISVAPAGTSAETTRLVLEAQDPLRSATSPFSSDRAAAAEKTYQEMLHEEAFHENLFADVPAMWVEVEGERYLDPNLESHFLDKGRGGGLSPEHAAQAEQAMEQAPWLRTWMASPEPPAAGPPPAAPWPDHGIEPMQVGGGPPAGDRRQEQAALPPAGGTGSRSTGREANPSEITVVRGAAGAQPDAGNAPALGKQLHAVLPASQPVPDLPTPFFGPQGSIMPFVPPKARPTLPLAPNQPVRFRDPLDGRMLEAPRDGSEIIQLELPRNVIRMGWPSPGPFSSERPEARGVSSAEPSQIPLETIQRPRVAIQLGNVATVSIWVQGGDVEGLRNQVARIVREVAPNVTKPGSNSLDRLTTLLNSVLPPNVGFSVVGGARASSILNPEKMGLPPDLTSSPRIAPNEYIEFGDLDALIDRGAIIYNPQTRLYSINAHQDESGRLSLTVPLDYTLGNRMATSTSLTKPLPGVAIPGLPDIGISISESHETKRTLAGQIDPHLLRRLNIGLNDVRNMEIWRDANSDKVRNVRQVNFATKVGAGPVSVNGNPADIYTLPPGWRTLADNLPATVQRGNRMVRSEVGGPYTTRFSTGTGGAAVLPQGIPYLGNLGVRFGNQTVTRRNLDLENLLQGQDMPAPTVPGDVAPAVQPRAERALGIPAAPALPGEPAQSIYVVGPAIDQGITLRLFQGEDVADRLGSLQPKPDQRIVVLQDGSGHLVPAPVARAISGGVVSAADLPVVIGFLRDGGGRNAAAREIHALVTAPGYTQNASLDRETRDLLRDRLIHILENR